MDNFTPPAHVTTFSKWWQHAIQETRESMIYCIGPWKEHTVALIWELKETLNILSYAVILSSARCARRRDLEKVRYLLSPQTVFSFYKIKIKIIYCHLILDKNTTTCKTDNNSLSDIFHVTIILDFHRLKMHNNVFLWSNLPEIQIKWQNVTLESEFLAICAYLVWPEEKWV